jgi:hypothetical protein
MLFLKQKKKQTILPIIFLASQETIPTSRVSLASILCTQSLFYPITGAACGVSSCVEDSSGGHRWISVSFSLDDYYISIV